MSVDSFVRYEVKIEDVEFRRIGDEALLARVYRPAGKGPFPAVVGVHGGAWTSGDRFNNQAIDQALASVGAVVVALDFRLAPAFRYPHSVSDVNYGIRWCKVHADELCTRADWVGAVGSSSGAHQVLLNAMCPRRPQYASGDAGPYDAEISYAVACWPIADPLARYQMAKSRNNARLIAAHHEYFGSEESMAEGNPQLILERGEKVSLPSLLVIQGTSDDNVTPDMAQRFVASYQSAGGCATLEMFPDQPHTFVTKDPNSKASLKAIEMIQRFVLARGIGG